MLFPESHRKNAWDGLFELQITFACLMLCFLPAGAFLVNTFGRSALLPFASIYGGIVLFVQHRLVNWKCPGCDKAFLRRGGTGFALLHRSRCGSCGLSRGRHRA